MDDSKDVQDHPRDEGGSITPSRSNTDHNSSPFEQLDHPERLDARIASADDNARPESTVVGENQAINPGAEAHVGSNATKPSTSAGTNTSTSTGYEAASNSGVSWSRAG